MSLGTAIDDTRSPAVCNSGRENANSIWPNAACWSDAAVGNEVKTVVTV